MSHESIDDNYLNTDKEDLIRQLIQNSSSKNTSSFKDNDDHFRKMPSEQYDEDYNDNYSKVEVQQDQNVNIQCSDEDEVFDESECSNSSCSSDTQKSIIVGLKADLAVKYTEVDKERVKARWKRNAKILFFMILNLLWVNVLIYFVERCGHAGIKANIKIVERDVRFNVGILRFIEGTTTSYYLIKLLRNDMGIRLRNYPKLNWLMHCVFILLRLLVVAFCILYLIPHWAIVEDRVMLILEKNQELPLDNKKHHSKFNQVLTFVLWLSIFLPTIAAIILFLIYLIVSVTCRPFWKYKQEIRTGLYNLYRNIVRDFITGMSRHYVLLDELALESDTFMDADLEQDVEAAKRLSLHMRHSDVCISVSEVRGEKNKLLVKFQKKFEGGLIPGKRYPFQEARDCPICQIEFKPNHRVIQLECGRLHVYHKKCFQEMMSLERIEKKCILCRKAICIEAYVEQKKQQESGSSVDPLEADNDQVNLRQLD